MILIITEKPSVTRDVASVIGNAQKQNIGNYTYYKCGDYLVANARGHLIRLAMPEEYDEKFNKRRVSDLPIIPEHFKLLPIDNGKEWLTALTKLIRLPEVESLICATDAGREGELIFRYIYNYTGCKKPFQRLWISSLTNESIKNGFENLLPGGAKDNMFRAGITRAKIDWLIGMNLSRLYSGLYNTDYSIGRVQTATVNMIVERDRDIKSFVKKPFYKLFLGNGAEWFDDDVNSFPEKKQAETVKNECEGKTVSVIKADTKRKTENRPLLHSLTSLQIEANDKYGYSSAFVLNAAQGLYEKKLLTYPRTDSSYITEDMKESVANIVLDMSFFNAAHVEKLTQQGLNFDKRIVDNGKVSDHHALLPTKELNADKWSGLTDYEQNILTLVINRLLSVLDEPYVYDEKSYVFECEGNKFKLTSKIPVSLGFREYDKIEISEIHDYKPGETFVADDMSIRDCETSPPKAFTESTLLKAMENIDRRIEDKEMRGFVKERGLGTPATRAAIIETIIKRLYIERKGKNLISTVKGQQMIDSVSEAVKSVEMTANMESRLADIEKGGIDDNIVLIETTDLIKKAIEREKNIPHENRGQRTIEPIGKCPKCGGKVYEGKKNFYCENMEIASGKGCIFSVFKEDFFFTAKKKSVTAAMMKSLLTKGKVLVKGLYSEKKDSNYDAYISFKDRQDKNGLTKIGFDMEFIKK